MENSTNEWRTFRDCLPNKGELISLTADLKEQSVPCLFVGVQDEDRVLVKSVSSTNDTLYPFTYNVFWKKGLDISTAITYPCS